MALQLRKKTHESVVYIDRDSAPRIIPSGEDFILEDLTSNPGLSDLASFCGLSRSHFARAFKQTTGLPPHRWLMMQRINRAKELLYKTKMPVSEIALECGFADQAHLTRVFTKAFGIGPGGFRRHRLN